MYVRFAWEGTAPVTHPIEIGSSLETPWPQGRLSLLRRYERAHRIRSLVGIEPVRKQRVPAIHLQIATSRDHHEMWVQRNQPRTITIADVAYDLDYGDIVVPLGFSLKLERFQLGYYPGGSRPRSFESYISLLDPSTVASTDRIVGMNHPAAFAGYSIFQSSYRLDPTETLSFLSVSRDPGRPIVYAGYISGLLGMLIVLATRMTGRSSAITPPIACTGA